MVQAISSGAVGAFQEAMHVLPELHHSNRLLIRWRGVMMGRVTEVLDPSDPNTKSVASQRACPDSGIPRLTAARCKQARAMTASRSAQGSGDPGGRDDRLQSLPRGGRKILYILVYLTTRIRFDQYKNVCVSCDVAKNLLLVSKI